MTENPLPTELNLQPADDRQAVFSFLEELPARGAGYRVAIVGATGAVGRILVRVLKERNFPVRELSLFASESSQGRWRDTPYGTLPVQVLKGWQAPAVDFAFVAVDPEVARLWVRRFARRGALVIDKSSYFRQKPYVPLVIPEVNLGDLKLHRRIFATPNCTTVPVAMALAPLHKRFGLVSVTVVSFQSVSGAGMEGLRSLERELDDPAALPSLFNERIAFNVIPWIGSVMPRGESGEEWKLRHETRRILGLPRLPLQATAVRVPTCVGHGAAIHAEFRRAVSAQQARGILADSEGLVVMDDAESGLFPTPLRTTGRDEVFVGRIRNERGRRRLALWATVDNLRKGAATNSVQIAEQLIALGCVGAPE